MNSLQEYCDRGEFFAYLMDLSKPDSITFATQTAEDRELYCDEALKVFGTKPLVAVPMNIELAEMLAAECGVAATVNISRRELRLCCDHLIGLGETDFVLVVGHNGDGYECCLYSIHSLIEAIDSLAVVMGQNRIKSFREDRAGRSLRLVKCTVTHEQNKTSN